MKYREKNGKCRHQSYENEITIKLQLVFTPSHDGIITFITFQIHYNKFMLSKHR